MARVTIRDLRKNYRAVEVLHGVDLDSKLRVQMRAEIRELHQRLSTTTDYVTHDQIEAMTMADKIVVMQDGAIEQVGSPLELYDRPVNRFVAGFIGLPAMNMIAGVVRRVTFGIRPEHLELGEDGLPVTVSVVEPTGSETHLITRFGSHDITAVFRERHRFAPGQAIHLHPKLDHIHIFDATTGTRLA